MTDTEHSKTSGSNEEVELENNRTRVMQKVFICVYMFLFCT